MNGKIDENYELFMQLFGDIYPDGVPQDELTEFYTRSLNIGKMIGDFSAVELADTMHEISEEYDEYIATPDGDEKRASWFARYIPALAMATGVVVPLLAAVIAAVML